MIPARRSALPASLIGLSALFALASGAASCASDDDVDLMGASSGAAGASTGAGGASAQAGAAGVTSGGSSAGNGTAGKSGSAAGGQGQGGAASGSGGTGAKAGAGGTGAGGTAGAGTAGTGGSGEGGTNAGGTSGGEGGEAGADAGGAGGSDGGTAGTSGAGGAAGSGEAGAGGSGPSGCCLTDADCPNLPFQQICAEGVCLSPPVIPAANTCWANSECSAQRPKCVAESICGCGEANCSSSKDQRGTCVLGSCCAVDDDCEGEQRCRRPGGQGGFGRCSPKITDGTCYENGDCKGSAKCSGQTICGCNDAGCTPKPGKCGG